MANLSYITTDEILSQLSRRLKEYRLAARMSQRELAELSGVGYTTVSHFEQGVHTNISLANFIALLRCVGMEKRLLDTLPPLPVPPLALREINKLIPKRVRRTSQR
ncbi:MAG: helix-turn-helix domain-containing protein [Candidatus Amulumruptor caecigallinarius]|nr:helix-turn-helix domain-containing protein [Candidatus Amulumruptor caecigallinarius]MCM1396580.1 helix-turn-helix domain-containing protein [Candidatus Amulumruptor caecigallinarius]MCM1453362.1 helix-turn-helix domain-containing protein [bacterium]